MEIDIFLRDFECFTNFETPMFNKWLDTMFIHTLAKNRSLLQTCLSSTTHFHLN
jgi:hypothetical protein